MSDDFMGRADKERLANRVVSLTARLEAFEALCAERQAEIERLRDAIARHRLRIGSTNNINDWLVYDRELWEVVDDG